MLKIGELNWIFTGKDITFESITVTNINETPAHLTFDIYFDNREPVKGLTYTLQAERVFSFSLDKPFSDQQYKIPLGQYSLVLRSDVPVVAVLMRQENEVQGYCC